MNDLDKIYSALMAAKSSNESLATWVKGADARDSVNADRREIDEGFQAYNRLSSALREGQRYIEPPDDWKPTECCCNTPTCSPPCGFCTDPVNSD